MHGMKTMNNNYNIIHEDQSLDFTPNLPTTPVLVSQLVGGHKALLSGNQ